MTARGARDRALLWGVVAVVSVLAGCETPAALSPSDSAPSATHALASPSAVASPDDTPSASTPGNPSAVSIELHALDARYVPAVAPISSGGQVLWTAGESWPSELWRYVPGSPEPERLFASPREASSISAVAAASSGYAFVELSKPAFGKGGWRIWFLSGPGEEPVELDRGRARGAGFAPTIAMDDERIAWAGFDEPPTGAVSKLSTVSIADLDAVTELRNLPIRDGLLWYPTLNGDELWYGIIRADFDLTGVGDEFHLETLDLANPAAPPVRFPGKGNDFNPAANDSFVAWKTTEPGDSALNWGTLHVMDRRTQAVAKIPVAKVDRPSIGDRYVAFEEISRSRLAVYDTQTGSVVDLAPPGSPGSYGGQSLSGRLLTFYTQTGEKPQIGWAILPE